jgi:hypothetical protein
LWVENQCIHLLNQQMFIFSVHLRPVYDIERKPKHAPKFLNFLN